MIVTLAGITMLINLSQLENVLVFMKVILEGRDTFFKPVQSLNTFLPNFVTLAGIAMLVIMERENALLPMLFRPDDRTMFVKLVSAKELSAIFVTPEGRTILRMPDDLNA